MTTKKEFDMAEAIYHGTSKPDEIKRVIGFLHEHHAGFQQILDFIKKSKVQDKGTVLFQSGLSISQIIEIRKEEGDNWEKIAAFLHSIKAYSGHSNWVAIGNALRHEGASTFDAACAIFKKTKGDRLIDSYRYLKNDDNATDTNIVSWFNWMSPYIDLSEENISKLKKEGMSTKLLAKIIANEKRPDGEG